MAKAMFRADSHIERAHSPAQREVLQEVRVKYQQLQALPPGERPDGGGRRQAGTVYLALEAEIHALAVRYQALA